MYPNLCKGDDRSKINDGFAQFNEDLPKAFKHCKLEPRGGALHIFRVRGRTIGKGIYFPDIGIKNDINFHNFGIRNGTYFKDF